MLRHIEQRAAELHARAKRKGLAGPLIVEALRAGIEGDGRAISNAMLGDEVLHDTARLIAESDHVLLAMSQ